MGNRVFFTKFLMGRGVAFRDDFRVPVRDEVGLGERFTSGTESDGRT